MTEFFRTWAEIDLDALEQNIKSAAARQKNKKIMAVVKANAYGHGAVQVARACAPYVCGFAVATLEEAIELRRGGCEKDILILSPVPKAQFGVAVAHGISTVLFSAESAKALSDSALAAKKTATAFLAVDTGMSRIGVSCDKSGLLEARSIIAAKNVDIKGVITHYACADCGDPEKSRVQSEKFDTFLAELKRTGFSPEIVSAGNTAAAIDLDEKYDTVRIGIALYGMYPSDLVKKEKLPLRPVLSLKTKISQIKTVPTGTGISYGHTFVTDRPTRVATLCAGYADGIPIALSGKGKVLIGGKYASILGKVCMDQMMVDISDIDGVKVGDTATVIGTCGNNSITAEDIASLAGTINYDVVCRLDFRVPRVYMRGGKITEVFSYIGI